MNIKEIYWRLRGSGYVVDQYNFDKQYLGKKPGYYAYLKSTDNAPSIEALMRLHYKLLETKNIHQTYGVNTGQLEELAGGILCKVKDRCLSVD